MKEKVVLFSSDLTYGGVPLSLLTITRLLDLKKYDVKIITHMEHPNYETEILKQCENALCFGISCITGSPIKTALEISKKVKEKYPNLPIIWGGWQAITLPDVTLSSPYVDYLCTGCGERTFSEFVDVLSRNDMRSIGLIEGISYKKGTRIIHNRKRTIEDLNLLPDFSLNLINWEKYLEVTDNGKRAVRIITSYGCPNNCGFCCEAYGSGRHWKGLSADRTVKFLVKLRKKIYFDVLIIGDSNFFVDENRVASFCKSLIKNKFKVKVVSVNGTANVLVNYKKATWELMKKSGFSSLLVGAESGNSETLRTIGKIATVEQTVKLNRICRDHNIKLIISTIVGIPIDDYFKKNKKEVMSREFDELTILYKRLYKDNPGNSFGIFFYTPLPATPLYQKAIALGFKPPKMLDEWSNYNLLTPHFNWIDKSLINKFITINSVFFYKGKNKKMFYEFFPFVLKIVAMPIFIFYDICFYLRFKLNYYSYFLDIMLIQFGIRMFYLLNKRFKFINIIDTSRKK